MRHRAARGDFIVAVSQHAGCTLAAADIGCARSVDRAVISLRTARAELEHCAALRRAGDAAGLGGDQRLVVDGEQHHGLHELRLDHRPGDSHQRLAGEHGRAFRHGPYVAFELEMAQVVEECLGKAAAAAQVGNILLGEVQVFKIVDQLFDACHDRVAAAIRHAAEEHIEIRAAVRYPFFEIAVRHREFVKVGQHCQVFFGHAELRPFAPSVLCAFIHPLHLS